MCLLTRDDSNLLETIEYSPQTDTLIFAGDFLAKSTHLGSLAVLDFLTRHSPTAVSHAESHHYPIYAVRGNHDQMVIQWRAWRDWFMRLHIKATLPSVSPNFPSYNAGKPVETGILFLELIEKEWEADRTKDPKGAVDPDAWADIARKRAVGTWREEWWRRIPTPGKGHAERDWHIFTDHYWLARYALSLLSLLSFVKIDGCIQGFGSRAGTVPIFSPADHTRSLCAFLCCTRRSSSVRSSVLTKEQASATRPFSSRHLSKLC